MNRRTTDESDYYKTLGVFENATAADITAAFHALARKHHPDTTEHDDPGNQQFKNLVEAYEVLADPQRRRAYDRRPARRVQVQVRYADDNEATRPTATAGRVQSSSRRGLDIHAPLPVTPEEARHGGVCQLRVTRQVRCSKCGGRGVRDELSCEACHATGREPRVDLVNVYIPPQVHVGAVLHLEGLGHEQATTAVASDGSVGSLILSLNVRPCW